LVTDTVASVENSVDKRVLIVQPIDIVRIGLAHIITLDSEMKVCAETRTLAHAKQSLSVMKPDMMVVDAAMEGGAGFSFIESIRSSSPEIAAIVFSPSLDSKTTRFAFQCGARGVIFHDEPHERILDGLNAVASGAHYVSPASTMSAEWTNQSSGKDLPTSILNVLSKRESDVFRLLAQGLSVKEIAGKLRIGTTTVETVEGRMKLKLGVKTMRDLRRIAILSTGPQAESGSP
jgi:DNA-binding NarL/FixJ family response regulator